MDHPYKILWSPWRYEYIKSTTMKHKGECVLCNIPRKSDDEAHIIYRGKKAYIVLNAYPYNTGHIMIVPYRHVDSLEKLDGEEIQEVALLIQASLKTLRKALNPEGFNIGVNIGRAAGAGIHEHVHIHVVPRWTGDSNFMTVVGATKTLPLNLEETYRILKSTWIELFGEEALDH
jgi:ATP adenylyltransferase